MEYIIRRTGHGRSILVNGVTQVIVCSIDEKKESELFELERVIQKLKLRRGGK